MTLVMEDSTAAVVTAVIVFCIIVLVIWLIVLQIQVVRIRRDIDLSSSYGPPALAIAGSIKRPGYSRKQLRRVGSKFSMYSRNAEYEDQNAIIENQEDVL